MDLAGQGYQGMPSMEQYGAGGKASPNWYQMPIWGKNAVTGEALTREQLQPKAYEPPPPPEPEPQQVKRDDLGLGEKFAWSNYLRDRDIYRNTQARLGVGTDDYNEMTVWNQYGGPWGTEAARSKFSKTNEWRYKPKSQWTMYDVQMARGRR